MFEETIPPAEPTLGATLPGDIHSGVPRSAALDYTGDERAGSEELNEPEESKMDLMAAINNKFSEAMAAADDDLF